MPPIWIFHEGWKTKDERQTNPSTCVSTKGYNPTREGWPTREVTRDSKIGADRRVWSTLCTRERVLQGHPGLADTVSWGGGGRGGGRIFSENFGKRLTNNLR